MGDGIIQSWEPTRSNCGRLRIAYAALFFFRCRSTCPQCTRKGPMNVSTLQRNRNGHPKEMTFSISRQWRFKRYSNLKLGYLKNSLVKTSCFPFSWPIRDTVPKKIIAGQISLFQFCSKIRCTKHD